MKGCSTPALTALLGTQSRENPRPTTPAAPENGVATLEDTSAISYDVNVI